MIKKLSIFLLFLILTIIGCKKEKTTPIPSIVGVWEEKYMIMTSYDRLNNIINIDTCVYIDINSDTLILFEEFTSDRQFFLFVNTFSDTNTSGSYTLDGNNLKINLPNNGYLSNRTIGQLDAENLELFQFSTIGTTKYKLLQKYVRF